MTGPGNAATGPEQAEGILRRLPREAWVVCAADGLRRGGLTATWLHGVSIDRRRPVVLLALAANHYTTDLVLASGKFAACLLARRQVAIGIRMALSSGREIDKLAGLDLVNTPADVPRLADCQAWIEGRVFARLTAGGRIYVWADVTAAQSFFSEPVLVDQDLFAAVTPRERETLLERLAEDVQIQQPLDEAWRRSLAGGAAEAVGETSAAAPFEPGRRPARD